MNARASPFHNLNRDYTTNIQDARFSFLTTFYLLISISLIAVFIHSNNDPLGDTTNLSKNDSTRLPPQYLLPALPSCSPFLRSFAF